MGALTENQSKALGYIIAYHREMGGFTECLEVLQPLVKPEDVQRNEYPNFELAGVGFTTFAQTKAGNAVHHPPHYNKHPSGIECIDVVRWFNFNLGNAIKYIWRSGEKDRNKEIEDLEKAIWYLHDEVMRLKSLQEL